jgi:hypothetical protein
MRKLGRESGAAVTHSLPRRKAVAWVTSSGADSDIGLDWVRGRGQRL